MFRRLFSAHLLAASTLCLLTVWCLARADTPERRVAVLTSDPESDSEERSDESHGDGSEALDQDSENEDRPRESVGSTAATAVAAAPYPRPTHRPSRQRHNRYRFLSTTRRFTATTTKEEVEFRITIDEGTTPRQSRTTKSSGGTPRREFAPSGALPTNYTVNVTYTMPGRTHGARVVVGPQRTNGSSSAADSRSREVSSVLPTVTVVPTGTTSSRAISFSGPVPPRAETTTPTGGIGKDSLFYTNLRSWMRRITGYVPPTSETSRDDSGFGTPSGNRTTQKNQTPPQPEFTAFSFTDPAVQNDTDSESYAHSNQTTDTFISENTTEPATPTNQTFLSSSTFPFNLSTYPIHTTEVHSLHENENITSSELPSTTLIFSTTTQSLENDTLHGFKNITTQKLSSANYNSTENETSMSLFHKTEKFENDFWGGTENATHTNVTETDSETTENDTLSGTDTITTLESTTSTLMLANTTLADFENITSTLKTFSETPSHPETTFNFSFTTQMLNNETFNGTEYVTRLEHATNWSLSPSTQLLENGTLHESENVTDTILEPSTNHTYAENATQETSNTTENGTTFTETYENGTLDTSSDAHTRQHDELTSQHSATTQSLYKESTTISVYTTEIKTHPGNETLSTTAMDNDTLSGFENVTSTLEYSKTHVHPLNSTTTLISTTTTQSLETSTLSDIQNTSSTELSVELSTRPLLNESLGESENVSGVTGTTQTSIHFGNETTIRFGTSMQVLGNDTDVFWNVTNTSVSTAAETHSENETETVEFSTWSGARNATSTADLSSQSHTHFENETTLQFITSTQNIENATIGAVQNVSFSEVLTHLENETTFSMNLETSTPSSTDNTTVFNRHSSENESTFSLLTTMQYLHNETDAGVKNVTTTRTYHTHSDNGTTSELSATWQTLQNETFSAFTNATLSEYSTTEPESTSPLYSTKGSLGNYTELGTENATVLEYSSVSHFTNGTTDPDKNVTITTDMHEPSENATVLLVSTTTTELENGTSATATVANHTVTDSGESDTDRTSSMETQSTTIATGSGVPSTPTADDHCPEIGYAPMRDPDPVKKPASWNEMDGAVTVVLELSPRQLNIPGSRELLRLAFQVTFLDIMNASLSLKSDFQSAELDTTGPVSLLYLNISRVEIKDFIVLSFVVLDQHTDSDSKILAPETVLDILEKRRDFLKEKLCLNVISWFSGTSLDPEDEDEGDLVTGGHGFLGLRRLMGRYEVLFFVLVLSAAACLLALLLGLSWSKLRNKFNRNYQGSASGPTPSENKNKFLQKLDKLESRRNLEGRRQTGGLDLRPAFEILREEKLYPPAQDDCWVVPLGQLPLHHEQPLPVRDTKL